MEEFKVRDRVVVTAPNKNSEGVREKFKGAIVNINDFREPTFKYAIQLDGFSDLVFVGEENIEKDK